MTNDAARLALRPVLTLAPATAPTEIFQNETLRPILKMQHELVLGLFRFALAKRKINLLQVPVKDRFARIKELVTRDKHLRGMLFGLVIGQFTAAELAFFLANDDDANRRITNLLVERLHSVDWRS